MKNIMRFGVAVAMAAAIGLGFAGSASADYLGDIELHVRACPADAVDLFEDCHGNPVADFEFDNDNIDSCMTDESGNCSLANDDSSYSEINWDPTGIVAIYCTADDEAIEFSEFDATDNGFTMWWIDEVDAQVACDFYMSDPSLPSANSGADVPNTGTGPMTQGANLGLLLAGVVALGGLAVASRRSAVR